MPAQGKVSLTRQTIYCFIPILDLYAAYHIKKLRWYLLIMILLGFGLSGLTSVINPANEYDPDNLMTIDGQIDWGYAILGENPALAIASSVIYQGIVFAVSVYVIRKWSKEWNLQFP